MILGRGGILMPRFTRFSLRFGRIWPMSRVSWGALPMMTLYLQPREHQRLLHAIVSFMARIPYSGGLLTSLRCSKPILGLFGGPKDGPITGSKSYVFTVPAPQY